MGSLDGGEDSEHNDGRFVEISKIFATQNTFSLGTEPFDGVCWLYSKLL